MPRPTAPAHPTRLPPAAALLRAPTRGMSPQPSHGCSRRPLCLDPPPLAASWQHLHGTSCGPGIEPPNSPMRKPLLSSRFQIRLGNTEGQRSGAHTQLSSRARASNLHRTGHHQPARLTSMPRWHPPAPQPRATTLVHPHGLAPIATALVPDSAEPRRARPGLGVPGFPGAQAPGHRPGVWKRYGKKTGQ